AFAPALAALGPGGLAREIGAGVAALYALPFPWPAGVAAAAGLAVFAGRSRGAGALALAALALAVGAGAAGAGAGALLPALRLGAEHAAFAVEPLALWSALAELRRGGDAGCGGGVPAGRAGGARARLPSLRDRPLRRGTEPGRAARLLLPRPFGPRRGRCHGLAAGRRTAAPGGDLRRRLYGARGRVTLLPSAGRAAHLALPRGPGGAALHRPR